MSKSALLLVVIAGTVLLLLAAVATWSWVTIPPEPEQVVDPAAAAEAYRGFLYGRITTYGGATYEGRLRWGGDEEAFWGDYFNGSKDENPWIAHRMRQIDLGRFFMARGGDIARIEARGGDVRVTLKSGTVFDLDRLEASDFDDGVRVWDGRRGVLDLDSLQISTIELLPAGRLVYDLDESETTETLDAPSQSVDYTIPFGLIASIVSPGGEERGAQRARVTLHSGEELQLESTGDLGEGNAGMLIFVEGRERPEYVPWTDVEQVDFDRPPAMYPPPGGR
jgi:hypothetical protein